ncbi:RNA polymerase, sigma 32 subunit, RpoH [Desulfocicer vacuolatum DSM 3385]|uniref:RNA polymerase sigma factor n=1 Tax=Desulfocicer vacuolatum DSM 3385 TaxID=1121400 RepID=A0A1W2D413_9BACT|nr:RNA polymerase factor sigma-32 [Desulfocicer vacuolatum]SMC92159.1 RNA polymerase, sigma 32 subunit, RpoH [Desulfocicer vacuolatum DSM 3385]
MVQKEKKKDKAKPKAATKAKAKPKAATKPKAKKKKIKGSASAVRRGYLTPVDKKNPVSTKALVKSDPLQSYLAEINRYRLLTREEEKDLGTKIQQDNDSDAAYIMVTSNLRLVVKIALDFQRIWMQNLLDLIQEGNIGLVRAVKKFDPDKNVKFSYYASFWIKAYILKFIMDNWRLVKIGTTQGQRKLFFRLKKEKQKLIEEGFDPRPKLLSERMGVSEQEVVEMDQRLDGWDLSLDEPLRDDSDTERIEFINVETDSTEERVARKEIEDILHLRVNEFKLTLNQRELDIFEKRIFSDDSLTLQEIGEIYSISRERVRQIENNIIKKMKEYFKNEMPDFAAYDHSQV